ncbi:MAG: deoxyribose-phosphate aldolase [Verrucomicrobiota bacterium]
MKYSYAELAGMIDHSLLQPGLTDAEAEAGCILAAEYGVASVCVKPYFVPRAASLLADTGVIVGCVIGFPAGNSSTEVKRYETEHACKDGAREIDMVINIGKALGGDWDYVEREIQVIADEAHKHGAKLKVIFENDYLPNDALKIHLCEICARVGADWVKTSTGYGFNKQPDGSYNYQGATEHDVKLMRQHSPAHVQVKAAGGVRDLDGLILVRDLGCTRLGASATKAILDEYRRREATGESGAGSASIGAGGY